MKFLGQTWLWDTLVPLYGYWLTLMPLLRQCEEQNHETALRWLRLIPWGCILCPAAISSVHTLSILWFQYACNGENWCLLLIISVSVRQRKNDAAVTSRSHTCLYLKTHFLFLSLRNGTLVLLFHQRLSEFQRGIYFGAACAATDLSHGVSASEISWWVQDNCEYQAQTAHISTLLLKGELACRSAAFLHWKWN